MLPIHSASIRSILVFVHGELLGDGFMKLPFLRALKTAFPQAKITWYAGSGDTALAGVLKEVSDQFIDEWWLGPDPRRLGLQTVASKWFKNHRKFDLIIDTQRNVSKSFFLKRLPHRYFISPAANFLVSQIKPQDRKKPQSLITQLLQLVELAAGPVNYGTVSIPVPGDLLREATAILPGPEKYIGLVVGAGGRFKCWPKSHFIILAQKILKAEMKPVFLLGPQEKDWETELRQDVPEAIFPLGEGTHGTIRWTMAIGKRLSAAVAADCGGGHLLAAADVPLVSLFGPTVADKLTPLTPRLELIKAQDFGGSSMDLIPPSSVWEGLEKLIR